MIIGVDFDNTIVSYDGIFHRVAVERGLIPLSTAISKTAVRDHLRRVDREDAWTEIQGHVYGTRMDNAEIFPGVVEFFRKCGERGVPVRIISHKTKFPYAGARHDLHEAARRWIERHHLFSAANGAIPADSLFFEATREAKLARVATAGCTHFIDDLPEFLTETDFPAGTRRILFDPREEHDAPPPIDRLSSWADLDGLVFGESSGAVADDGMARAAVELMAELGLTAAGPLEPFAVGGNNRIFRVETREGRPLVVKSYYRGPGGGSERLSRERKFYALAALAAASIPRSYGWDETAAIGLFEKIDGRKLAADAISASEVAAALAFFRSLNGARRSPAARALPPAAEACFSVDEHIQVVDRRVARLGEISREGSSEREAREFVEGQLVPAWRDARALIRRSGDLGMFGHPLPAEARCVSPSDFGFHNCLRRGDGSLVFFDFEHAGWDDPAKTVCDFFCQPDVPVPWRYFDPFAAEVAGVIGGEAAAGFMARCRALVPVYRLKWCCIMLNEFCREDRDRRAFALGAAAIDERTKRQLDAARSALAGLRETIKN